MKRIIVEKDGDLTGLLLDEYKGALKYGRLMKLYRDKDVKVNGKRVNGETSLKKGDVVEVYYDFQSNIAVVYCDDDVLVCDKPSGIESVAFFEQVKNLHSTAIFTHRLDRNTSGLMIFALNESAYNELYHGFNERTFDKEYLACVNGFFTEKNGILKDYLIKNQSIGRVSVFKEKKKGALLIETGYSELARGTRTSLLSVKLYTGRTHQIRAHLAFHGHFVIGDGKYGDDRINRELGFKRQLLRAVKLTLKFKRTDYLYRLNGKTFSVDGGEVLKGLV